MISCPFLHLYYPWMNLHLAFQVYCDVEPKRHALAQANLELATATEKLEAIRKKLAVSAASNREVVPRGGNPLPSLDSHLQTGLHLSPTKQEGI